MMEVLISACHKFSLFFWIQLHHYAIPCNLLICHKQISQMLIICLYGYHCLCVCMYFSIAYRIGHVQIFFNVIMNVFVQNIMQAPNKKKTRKSKYMLLCIALNKSD